MEELDMKQLIAPVAIDFGANNTGVYYEYYDRGTKPHRYFYKKGRGFNSWGEYTSLFRDFYRLPIYPIVTISEEN